MSTHGCFAPLFPHTRLLRPDGGPPETAAYDDYYYQGGAYYDMEDVDDQE